MITLASILEREVRSVEDKNLLQIFLQTTWNWYGAAGGFNRELRYWKK